jgi:hypothetical protein
LYENLVRTATLEKGKHHMIKFQKFRLNSPYGNCKYSLLHAEVFIVPEVWVNRAVAVEGQVGDNR